MYQFTVTTPKAAFRVNAKSYAHIENAARESGVKILGILRDGDTAVYDPRVPKSPRRETAISWAFEEVSA